MNTPMPFNLPAGWPQPAGDIFKDNMPTTEIFYLGKKLFFDANLSSDGATSCAGCHQPFAAFSTFDHDLSHGVTDSFTTRNAPGLFNLAWRQNYHWDGGVTNLEMQPLNPITAANEMGETLENVIKKIQEDGTYKPFFVKAYGDSAVSSKRLLKALAQFVGQLISAGSRYDKWKKGTDSLSKFELRGYTLYQQNCSSCHPEPLFTDNLFHNTGLPLNRFADVGRQHITSESADSLSFRTPSLRNVQLTYPYLHDGQMYSVDEVITHYQNLDTTTKHLDPILKKRKIKLSAIEKNQLIYFLYTLTDTAFTKDKKFNPDRVMRYKH